MFASILFGQCMSIPWGSRKQAADVIQVVARKSETRENMWNDFFYKCSPILCAFLLLRHFRRPRNLVAIPNGNHVRRDEIKKNPKMRKAQCHLLNVTVA